MTMTYRLRNIFIALLFATFAVAITIAYASTTKSRADAKTVNVNVLVATRDIPVGTPGKQLLSGGYAKLESVARTGRVPDAVADRGDVRDLSVSQQIYAGEQISTRRFAASQAPGVLAQLSGTLRAVQIAGNGDQVLAGTLESGEHVDVLASLDYPEGSSTHATRVIARNLLVLEAGTGKGSSRITTGSGSASVLLAMTDSQAQAVFHAVTHGDWMLALRPVTNPANSALTVDSTATILQAAR